MANEDCVGTLRIERTISFIGKLYGGKRGAAIQRQRPGQDHLPGEAETVVVGGAQRGHQRSEEHTSELQSLMRNSYAVFCLKKTNNHKTTNQQPNIHHNTQTN